MYTLQTESCTFRKRHLPIVLLYNFCERKVQIIAEKFGISDNFSYFCNIKDIKVRTDMPKQIYPQVSVGMLSNIPNNATIDNSLVLNDNIDTPIVMEQADKDIHMNTPIKT